MERAMANANETDEAFARRLQRQEMGLPDSHTPLVAGRQNAQNAVVVNARQNEMASSRATVCAILITNIPQIVAAMVVLAVHWNDPDVCDRIHTDRWKWWVLVSTVRMTIYCSVVFAIHWFRPWLIERPRYLGQATSFRNVVDAIGLIWFVVGYIWLFGDDDNSCKHPEKSPIYGVGVAMLIINTIQICLPCIIAVALIPIFCFCMPCLIRALARLQNTRANVGATDAMLQSLPVTVIDQDYLSRLPSEDDRACPICLSELNVGEEARLLACKHMFHRQCVDEWLRVNASCPTCRTSILPREGASAGDGSASGRINLVGGSGGIGGGGSESGPSMSAVGSRGRAATDVEVAASEDHPLSHEGSDSGDGVQLTPLIGLHSSSSR